MKAKNAKRMDFSLCRIMGLVRGVLVLVLFLLVCPINLPNFVERLCFLFGFGNNLDTQMYLQSFYACRSLVDCVGFMLDLDESYRFKLQAPLSLCVCVY